MEKLRQLKNSIEQLQIQMKNRIRIKEIKKKCHKFTGVRTESLLEARSVGTGNRYETSEQSRTIRAV